MNEYEESHCQFAVLNINLFFIFCFLELKFSGRKLGVAACKAKEDQPLASFLKQNPKTKKMKFFNDVTREIYESA